MDTLSFSWELAECDWSLVDFVQIRVMKENREKVYDSGMLKNYKDTKYVARFQLCPRTRYYWDIEISSISGDKTSESSFFETGKMCEKWDAEWISAEEDNANVMPVLYKEFNSSKEIEEARLYIFGAGLYEAYLNGEKIGNEFLSPGYHSYDMHLECQTFEIKKELFQKENRIEIILGEGWYKGRFGFDGQYRNLYGDRKKLIAELRCVNVDETETFIITDTSWKAKESSIQSNGIYDGEIIDEMIGFHPLQIKVLSDEKDKLVDRFNLPITKCEEFVPKNVFMEQDGSIVYDFGKIITGWCELDADFEQGQKVELLYGELLQDGKFYNENLRTAKAEFCYTSIGGENTIRPHFTFYGFQYVKVKGISVVKIKSIIAFRLMSDIEETGSIMTSNGKINQLFENTKQSQRCNFVDIPTDCPQRDERMGWTGDVTVFSETANYHMDCQAFFDHYLCNLQKEQELLSGSIPFFVPYPKITEHDDINPFYISSGAAVWGDVAAVLPWNLYVMYGNKENLEKYYVIMKSWVDHVSDVVKSNPVPNLWQNERQLGDWLALDNGNIYNPIGLTDPGMIASAYYYQSVKYTGNAAHELGYAEEYELITLENKIKKSFVEEYYDKNGILKVPVTQTACALLLNTGLFPENRKSYLVTELERVIRENNYHLNTGFVGTYQLMPALSESGLNSLAYRLLLNEEYPSWLYEVNLGATTVWERWNSLQEDGTISGTEMNSLNHYAYGCVAGWMYKYMCGFRPQMHKKIKMILQPRPDKSIRWIKASWKTVIGIYQIEWKYKEDKLFYKVDIPVFGNAIMIFENGKEILLDAGHHAFDEEGNIS